ncbi:methionine--tRNA ligase [Candidatus Parcubacteria bacterium]|nr:methionine--tRNA ligase [Candidatus Parcubacteria bacterium]
MKNKFYITTAIVYTNGNPHIGYAFELILTDVIARYHRQKGDDTMFLTGTDEHGSSVAKAAAKNDTEPAKFVEGIVGKVQELTKILNISNDDFIRTTDKERHWPAVEKLWRILVANGDLYKKDYEGLYCVGHEAFIKKNDLVDGVCPLHKTEPEKVKEENWFFKLTKYKPEIRKRIESGELEILPHTKKNELLNLLDDAEDVSFSRPSKTLTWGIPVPDDSSQTIYVWADALTNYISALGWSDNSEQFKNYWPADVHLVGKDILRFHAMIWPAMLISAGIQLPKAIYVHGFINVDGEKMSKTIGNVIDPFEIVQKYGVDIVRYFLLREIPSDQDGDFSEKKLVERYNGDLANGLGNLVQRVATLIESNLDGELIIAKENILKFDEDQSTFNASIDQFRLHEALNFVWAKIAEANLLISERKPWDEAKTNPAEFLKTMTTVLLMIERVNHLLEPFMPETSNKISEVFQKDGDTFRIKKGPGLFPRLES